MKHIYILIILMSLSIYEAKAQGEMDAIKLSRNDVKGTARGMGMGGAVGALEADATAVLVNPATIGLFSESEVATTLNINGTAYSANLGETRQRGIRFKTNLENASVVFSNVDFSGEGKRLTNVSISYNRVKSFNRDYVVAGMSSSSLVNYMADRANNIGVYQLKDILGEKGKASGADWLAVLGYNSSLLYSTRSLSVANGTTQMAPFTEGSVRSNLKVKERGSVDSYEISDALNYGNVFFLGLGMVYTHIDYKMTSQYNERFVDEKVGDFTLNNNLKTTGHGFQFKFGMIYKPIDNLTFGLSYHSTGWNWLKDEYSASIGYNTPSFVVNNKIFNARKGQYSMYDEKYKYSFRTPDKWTFSVVGLLSPYFTVSMDYERTNFRMMTLSNGDDIIKSNNKYTKADFKTASSIRLGMELELSERWTGRLGYVWQESPLEAKFKNNEREVMVVGSVPHYTLNGDIHRFTGGLGYKINDRFTIDAAFVATIEQDDVYSYPKIGTTVLPHKATMDTYKGEGLITLRYKFGNID